ncbi:MAG TPA: hypothetical protein VFZ09_50485 [Archangium sp.]|uniref:hypothetical protein n=1 Tax=Archangium sp. TaxID=1872627 RepID=UPI002E36B0D0|nr:hypothetical protein [Archangium sp.]HEX5754514.1 hypothetical protein [Archangium sp.]
MLESAARLHRMTLYDKKLVDGLLRARREEGWVSPGHRGGGGWTAPPEWLLHGRRGFNGRRTR